MYNISDSQLAQATGGSRINPTVAPPDGVQFRNFFPETGPVIIPFKVFADLDGDGEDELIGTAGIDESGRFVLIES